MQQLYATVIFNSYMQQLNATVICNSYRQQLYATVICNNYMHQFCATFICNSYIRIYLTRCKYVFSIHQCHAHGNFLSTFWYQKHLFNIPNELSWTKVYERRSTHNARTVAVSTTLVWGNVPLFYFFLHTALYIVTNFLGFQICMKNTHYTIVVEPVFSEHFIRKHVLQGGFIHINMMYKEVLFLQTYCTRRFCSYKHAVQGGLVPINMLYKEVLFL